MYCIFKKSAIKIQAGKFILLWGCIDVFHIPYNDTVKHLNVLNCDMHVSVYCVVKALACTVVPQSFHHDLHLCELVAVVLLGRSLAGRLHVDLREALAGRIPLHLL